MVCSGNRERGGGGRVQQDRVPVLRCVCGKAWLCVQFA